MNRKALEEKRADLQSKMSDILSKAKIEKRELTQTETEEFGKHENEIRSIDKQLKKEEDSLKKTVTEQRSETEIRESKQFVSYIRGVLSERAETNMDFGANGAIIPTTIAKKIITKAFDMSSILHDATRYNTKGTLVIPCYTENGDSGISMGYADEFKDLEAKAGNFTSITLGGFLAGALTKVSKSLIANTDIDLENKVIELTAEAISKFEERECIKGTEGKVEGLRGVKLSVTAGSATVITADELIKLKNKIKKRFRKNAKWIMANDTLTAIELLKDGEDRFIFREDMNGEFDGYLLGYPVEVSDNMDDIATGKTVIYFGDMSGLALKQRDDALELEVLREKFATQHAVGINAWLEFDAKMENEQKIAKLVMG